MAVARQGAATATASPARLARPTNSRSERLCFAKGWMDGAAWRGGAYVARGHAALDASGHASAGGYARCGARASPIARRCVRGHSRSCLSISPHLGSSTRTPSSIRRKCRPRRLPRGTEHQLAKKATHHTSARTVRKTHAFAGRSSPFVIHGVLTPPEPTVSRDAVTEPAQQDVSRPDYRARLSTRHVPAGRSFLDPFAPVSAGCSAHLSSRFLKFPRPPSHPVEPLVANIDRCALNPP